MYRIMPLVWKIKMLLHIPDFELSFTFRGRAGTQQQKTTKERGGGNSSQGSMSVLTPQECRFKFDLTVVTATDKETDKLRLFLPTELNFRFSCLFLVDLFMNNK